MQIPEARVPPAEQSRGEYLVRCIGADDEGVDVRELVGLGGDGRLELVVLALVVDDDVHLAGHAAADVRPKHDGVRCIPGEGLHLLLPAFVGNLVKLGVSLNGTVG